MAYRKTPNDPGNQVTLCQIETGLPRWKLGRHEDAARLWRVAEQRDITRPQILSRTRQSVVEGVFWLADVHRGWQVAHDGVQEWGDVVAGEGRAAQHGHDVTVAGASADAVVQVS